MGFLEKTDPQIAGVLAAELSRQRNTLELIASENFTDVAVLEAQGSVLTNKYAEGYPGNRYYGGCQYADEAENLARDRARELFGGDYVNVQPHSGAQANMAVYLGLLEVGDTVLGLNLTHGGHLTHGSPVNSSGILYNFVPYGVSRETERIDYDDVRRLALQHRPRMILTGGSAYARTIDFERFREIADEIDAFLVVDMAHIAGLVAAGEHPSPVPFCEAVTSTTHKTLRGPRAGFIICREEYGTRIDKAVFPGVQGGPLMHVIAAKAVAFKQALTDEFREYQVQVVKNARVLAEALGDRGFRIVSGGTDTALVLVDLTDQGVTGKEAQLALDEVGVTVNKNTIPFEERSPVVTSGIRLGTPSVTTRGMREPEMNEIAEMIAEVLTGKLHSDTAAKVRRLCEAFPLYPELGQGDRDHD